MMNDKLKDLIQKAKKSLNAKPNGIVFGEFREGNKRITKNIQALEQYFEFLRESDGARCGSIDFWSWNELPSRQYRVTELPGGMERWLEIGQVVYEPLVINKNDGKVYLFSQQDMVNARFICDRFDEFLIQYVFGKDYRQIVADGQRDEWFQLINEIN